MNGIVVTIYLVSKLELKLKNNVLDAIYEIVTKFKAKRGFSFFNLYRFKILRINKSIKINL